MRIYIPAHLGLIDALDRSSLNEVIPAVALEPGTLVFALPDAARTAAEADHRDAVEELEFAALYGAADHSVDLLATVSVPRQRLVISADIDAGELRAPDTQEANNVPDELVPYVMCVDAAVPAAPINCVHIDEPAAAEIIAQAIAGDEDAASRTTELDLLWYDSSELGELPRAGISAP